MTYLVLQSRSCNVFSPHLLLHAFIPPTSLFLQLDGWNGTDRNHIDSFVPQQDLADSYLPSFQSCVEQGKVTQIM